MNIRKKSPLDQEAVLLMEELSKTLESMTGNSGKHSFHAEDVTESRALFAVAYTDDECAVGCGAIRPVTKDIAEVKRMYARNKGEGIGRQLLLYLQEEAKSMGYQVLYVETRKINQGAVAFYLKNGYQIIENYGNYKGREEAICFEKRI